MQVVMMVVLEKTQTHNKLAHIYKLHFVFTLTMMMMMETEFVQLKYRTDIRYICASLKTQLLLLFVSDEVCKEKEKKKLTEEHH